MSNANFIYNANTDYKSCMKPNIIVSYFYISYIAEVPVDLH